MELPWPLPHRRRTKHLEMLGCGMVRCSAARSQQPLTVPGLEWLTLPIKYRDLVRNTRIVWTVWDMLGPSKVYYMFHWRLTLLQRTPVGGTCLDIFSDNGTLRKGQFVLRVCLISTHDDVLTSEAAMG